MKLTGTITKVLPQKSGVTKKGGTWAAQQYVLEAKDDSGDKCAVVLEAFGQEHIDEFAIAEGETVTVKYNPNVYDAGDRVFGKNSIITVERPDVLPTD